MFYYALVIGVIATVVFLILRVRKAGLPGAFSKAGASVGFILVALAAVFDRLQDPSPIIINQTFNHWSLFLIAGLIFGVLGDIFLDLKFVVLDKTDAFTFAGFGAFMLGHLMYLATIWNTMSFPIWTVFIAIAFGAIVSLVIVFGERKMGVKYGKFKAISAVYGGLLAFVVAMCGGIVYSTNLSTGAVLLFVGSVLFLISDLILSGTYFGENKNTRGYVLANHITYYAAQYCIASALLFI